jgi:hypothetical protein
VSRALPSYYTKKYILGAGSVVREVVVGDFIDLINYSGDIDNVAISFNDGEFVDITKALPCTTFFQSIAIRNNSTQPVSLTLLIGREYFKAYVTRAEVSLDYDRVGIAKDLTLKNLINAVNINYANDYDLLTIDLSIARTDVLIATNVIALYVVDASSGATYSIKLFSTDRPALDQSVLPVGSGIERLDRANVYFSNPSRSGAYLKLLILRRV